MIFFKKKEKREIGNSNKQINLLSNDTEIAIDNELLHYYFNNCPPLHDAISWISDSLVNIDIENFIALKKNWINAYLLYGNLFLIGKNDTWEILDNKGIMFDISNNKYYFNSINLELEFDTFGNGINNPYQLLHIKNLSTNNSRMGTSFLLPILNDICLIIAGNIYNKNVLTNGARIDGIMSYKGTLTDNQYEGIKNTWQSFFSGVKNAGKTLFLNTFDGDIEYNSLSKSNKDMDFINLISMAQISIYKRFKIPLPMVETSKQTYSNYSEAQAQLYDNAVLPILDDILLQLRQLLSNKSIKINIDSLPLSTKIKYYDNMVRQSETKVLTPNEIRATLNLKPLKGGDILRDTATTPIAYDGNYSDISLYDIPTKKE